MPHLICLVQRLTLRDGRLIRENEEFEVDETEAHNLIVGGHIVKEAPEQVKAPEEVVEKPQPAAELYQKSQTNGKKRGR